MIKGRPWLIVVLLSLMSGACQVTEDGREGVSSDTKTRQTRAKNIILLIGDGMGLSHISAALYSNKNRLTLEKFPVIGFQKTHAYDDLTTDSAAGATALACGKKTFVRAIGVDSDTLACKTIIEEAEEYGLATGLIATSTLVHATPAAFVAHEKSRALYENIAADYLDVELDYLVGGGKSYFEKREIDHRNLYKELVNKDYQVSDFTLEPLLDISVDPTRNFVYFTADHHPAPVSAGRDYLDFVCRQAPLFLEKHSDEGFFLMVEGSQIDWAGHANDGAYAVEELLDFDRAVRQVLNYARRRGNTLVLVTADHETGGMALNPGSKMGEINSAFTTNRHTSVMVPVFAYGPSSELFSGIYDNTDVYRKMRQALGFNKDRPATASY